MCKCLIYIENIKNIEKKSAIFYIFVIFRKYHDFPTLTPAGLVEVHCDAGMGNGVEKARHDIASYIGLCTGVAPDLVAHAPSVVPENRQLRCQKPRFR